MRNRLTIAMPYYEAPQMLCKHLETWQNYPDWIKDQLRIILVDDGSPNFPAKFVLDAVGWPTIPTELYRIDEDIAWNHGGARNLAFTHAVDGWVLLTDLDHVIPLESLASFLTKTLRTERFYIPGRYRQLGVVDWEEIEPHRDSFILTKEMYWEVGGYDEDFSGYWNGVSHLFRKHLLDQYDFEVLENCHLTFYDNKLIPDAQVESLGRKGSAYDIKDNPREYEKMAKRLNKIYKPKNQLRFTWKQQT